MKNSFRFIALFALFMLNVSVSAAQSASASPSPKPTATPDNGKLERTTKFDGNVEFPDVDGWEMSEKYKYPTDALGYSVGYESPKGGRVTIYVYNGGRKNIPNSLTGVLADEMDKAKSEIKAAVDAGAYESAKVVKSETITLGGTSGNLKVLYTSLDLTARGNKLHSEIYLFPYQNHFVKIRATRAKANEKSPDFAMLLTEIDALFLK